MGLIYCESGEAFGSATHFGGDLPRAVVPHDDLGDHIPQPRVTQARNDQDDVLKSAPIEDNRRHPRLFITAPRSSDRIKSSVLFADVRSSVGDQR